MLIRLVYASTAQSGVDLAEFKRILLQAQANNHRRDLTGMLAFNTKIFLQALEGSRDQINDLYGKLVSDPRHNTVTMLSYKEIEERHWANWSMGFAAPNTDNRALFLKYSQQSVFNPYSMKADAVEKMLMELSSTAIAMTAPIASAPSSMADSSRVSRPAPLTADGSLPRVASRAPVTAPAATSSSPGETRPAFAASAPAPLGPSSAGASSRPASLTASDRTAPSKAESTSAGGLFARFLNK